MPRTRAQRRHALATALDEDTLSYVLSFLPTLGVVPGRLYTLTGGARAKTDKHELSLKAILAPRRRRLIKCPDDIPLLENAVAEAREGDVVLLTESVELQAPIIAPPFRITIAAVRSRRFGRARRPGYPGQMWLRGSLERQLGNRYAGANIYVNTDNFPGHEDPLEGNNVLEEMLSAPGVAAAVVASGEKVRLELRGLAWVGVRFYAADPELSLAVDAQAGASVDVENCWFSNFSASALRASGGARIFVRDATVGRSACGVSSQGAGSVVIVENCLFIGNHILGASAYRGGRIDVRSCRIDCCRVSGLCSKGEGSHIRIRETMYLSRLVEILGEEIWSPRFTVKEGGCVTFCATENDTYEWVSAVDFEGERGELVEGDGGDLEGFEDLSGGDPEPVLSCWYAEEGFSVHSGVREGIEFQKRRVGAPGFDGTLTYIPA